MTVFQESTIQCPQCGETISIDNALTHQIEEKVKKSFESTHRIKEQVLIQKSEALKKREDEVAESQKSMEAAIAQKVSDQLTTQKLLLFKEARLAAEKEQSAKTAFLEEELKNKSQKLMQAVNNELKIRKEKSKLEEDKKLFELEKIRQLEELKQSLFQEASQKATEEQQYIIAQLKKQLTDAIKAKDDLSRKLEQGSQQSQGEVLELALEEQLRTEFPRDEILAVPKGISGADAIQKIFNRSGHLCGQIVWEFKKTKNWNEGWIQKLKDDQRVIKADLAVIVSAALPDNVKGFAFVDGIWICEIKFAVQLAAALRISLKAVAHEKVMAMGKNEKMEVLYAYLTGVEFKQRVEAIVEAFSSMDAGLKKERMAYEKIWNEREKQIKKMMTNTVGMYGDLSGLVRLPQIRALELEKGNLEGAI